MLIIPFTAAEPGGHGAAVMGWDGMGWIRTDQKSRWMDVYIYIFGRKEASKAQARQTAKEAIRCISLSFSLCSLLGVKKKRKPFMTRYQRPRPPGIREARFLRLASPRLPTPKTPLPSSHNPNSINPPTPQPTTPLPSIYSVLKPCSLTALLAATTRFSSRLVRIGVSGLGLVFPSTTSREYWARCFWFIFLGGGLRGVCVG